MSYLTVYQINGIQNSRSQLNELLNDIKRFRNFCKHWSYLLISYENMPDAIHNQINELTAEVIDLELNINPIIERTKRVLETCKPFLKTNISFQKKGDYQEIGSDLKGLMKKVLNENNLLKNEIEVLRLNHKSLLNNPLRHAQEVPVPDLVSFLSTLYDLCVYIKQRINLNKERDYS